MSNERTTIALSKQTFEKLHTLERKLRAIVRKKLTPDKVIQILLCTRPLEDQLTDMIIEAEALYPSKKPKKEE